MGLIGKFVSNAWNGIKNGLGTAGKLIQSGANKAWNFVKDNQDTIGKIAGTALGTGINLYTGGAAAPFINGANNFIQDLPDNAFTKHLKNIAKGAVFDYGQVSTRSKEAVPKDPEKKPEQTNAATEYQAPRMSSFTTPTSAVSSPTIVRRTIVKQMPLKKSTKAWQSVLRAWEANSPYSATFPKCWKLPTTRWSCLRQATRPRP